LPRAIVPFCRNSRAESRRVREEKGRERRRARAGYVRMYLPT